MFCIGAMPVVSTVQPQVKFLAHFVFVETLMYWSGIQEFENVLGSDILKLLREIVGNNDQYKRKKLQHQERTLKPNVIHLAAENDTSIAASKKWKCSRQTETTKRIKMDSGIWSTIKCGRFYCVSERFHFFSQCKCQKAFKSNIVRDDDKDVGNLKGNFTPNRPSGNLFDVPTIYLHIEIELERIDALDRSYEPCVEKSY
uniref:Uncharacterized protein n=1 Tax=Glossina austeni TaxID=7395 RepID=A0A1A9UWK8_GLOAU